MDEDDDDDTPDITEINLTNQLIGEVQAFVFVMRCQVYDFYGFRQLKDDGLIDQDDFGAIEDDVLFIIHSQTVSKEVFENLLILSRMLKNQEDKDLRKRYKDIQTNRGQYFPLEYDRTIAESAASFQ